MTSDHSPVFATFQIGGVKQYASEAGLRSWVGGRERGGRERKGGQKGRGRVGGRERGEGREAGWTDREGGRVGE